MCVKMSSHVNNMQPESEYQKLNVLQILQSIPGVDKLLQSHIEVWNKTDLMGSIYKLYLFHVIEVCS